MNVTLVHTHCVNCDADIVAEEPNCCMVCGFPLCAECYDESPYCKECERDVVSCLSGDCLE
jgi:hypothetical protein